MHRREFTLDGSFLDSLSGASHQPQRGKVLGLTGPDYPLVLTLEYIMNRKSTILSFFLRRWVSSVILSPDSNYNIFPDTQIMQNKPNFKYAKINLSSFVTSKYVHVGQLVIQTNKAKTNPIKPNTKPIKPNTKPIKAKTKPIQTQLSQFRIKPDGVGFII